MVLPVNKSNPVSQLYTYATFYLLQYAKDARSEHSSNISRTIATTGAAVIWLSCLFPDCSALARRLDQKQPVRRVISSEVISGDVMITKEVTERRRVMETGALVNPAISLYLPLLNSKLHSLRVDLSWICSTGAGQQAVQDIYNKTSPQQTVQQASSRTASWTTSNLVKGRIAIHPTFRLYSIGDSNNLQLHALTAVRPPIVPFRGVRDLHVTQCVIGPQTFNCQMASKSVERFKQDARMWQTDRQMTDMQAKLRTKM